MKILVSISVICLFLLAVIQLSLAGPVAETSSLKDGSDSKSAFGQPFDEIVVESTLNVKRKSIGGRQSRNDQVASVRTKRQGFPNFPKFQFPSYGSAVAAAQAQSHNAKSPSGNVGASASGGQSQSLSFGPNGPVGAASFAGAQQYRLPNGQTFDVSFGNSVGATENPGGTTESAVSFTCNAIGSNTAGGGSVAISGLNGK